MIKYRLGGTMKNTLVIVFIIFCGCTSSNKPIFEPTVESLQQYKTPDWFKDAKFGIYCHWNAQSASKSENSGWYARRMYQESHPAYTDHLKNWGHPSEVGYKDIIKAWKADKFDAARWIGLFKDAGAKYVLTMAVHHDNFDFWDSKYQPRWNSLNYGPKVDVCGEMRKECLKAGLRWGVRTHLARTYSWFQTNKGADKKGDKIGVPYDGNNPEYEDLYLEKATPEQIGEEFNQIRHPLIPSERWIDHWKSRMFDLIDNYHPDHFYFDGAVPFMSDSGRAGLEVIAHYYNHNASRHNGVNEGVMVIKNIENHGFYYDNISTVVLERRRENDIVKIPRETENSIGPWFYTGDETKYRNSQSLLHEMIDVVSKNCNFVLNIPPKPDGTFDDSSLKILKDFGRWLKTNGEAIYSTRSWKIFGEGDVRFTVKEKNLYAIFFNKPANKILIRSLRLWQSNDIESINFLGTDKKVDWHLSDNGLELIWPENFEDELAFVFKIKCSKLLSELPYAVIDLHTN
jgi:alpha-L-fucosidase